MIRLTTRMAALLRRDVRLLSFAPGVRDKIPVDPVSGRIELPIWRQPDGNPVSCVDKIKVLNENLTELHQMAQNALEDAILMGCDEGQIRAVLQQLMIALENPYDKTNKRG